MREKVILGVIGGGWDREFPDDLGQRELAKKVGAAIATSGHLLLTGGKPISTLPEPPADPKQVKYAAMDGAEEASKRRLLRRLLTWCGRPQQCGIARLIGILDSKSIVWGGDSYRLFLDTGLKSLERDPINGVTPDVIIAFRGGKGTLLELAFAAVVGRPVVFVDSTTRLRRKLTKYEANGEFTKACQQAIRCYPQIENIKIDEDVLRSALDRVLRLGNDFVGPAHELVKTAITVAKDHGLSLESGFPGIPGSARSKQDFESRIQRIMTEMTQ